MNFYIIYINEYYKVTFEIVDELLKSIEGVLDIRYNVQVDRSVIQWVYRYEGDRTIGRLSLDLGHINLSGHGLAGLKLAYEFQVRYDDPLHLTDSDYSCDLGLKSFSSFEDLKRAYVVH